jgi:AhpD family alkylhydroperoxidase
MTMEPRLNLFDNPVAARFAKYLASAGKALSDSALPAATQHLVEIRASQLNGCAVCLDMHTKDAAHAGESQQRLNLVAAWREANVFTEAEQAALELTEQAPGLLTPPGVSPTRPGRMRPSTTTTSSSARWWRSSPGSTPGIA